MTGNTEPSGVSLEAAEIGTEAALSIVGIISCQNNFEPDPQLFPSSYIAETISVARQNGEEDTAVKISIPIPSGSSYTEPISFAIPVLLKEEFQKPGARRFLPSEPPDLS